MNELFEKSIHTLELPRVLAMLADEAVTEEGKENCLSPVQRPRQNGQNALRHLQR